MHAVQTSGCLCMHGPTGHEIAYVTRCTMPNTDSCHKDDLRQNESLLTVRSNQDLLTFLGPLERGSDAAGLM